MNRMILVAGGAVLGVISLGVLALAAIAGADPAPGPDTGWFVPYLGSGGVVAAGIGLVVAALIMGIGMGRWRHPKAVPSSTARHHEGLQG